MPFDLILIVAGLLAGAVAAVTGFGIGSLLTPVLALQVDTRLAVAAVSIPHLIGTSLRFALMRGRVVDRRVLWSFGLTSAAGGLAGAMLYGVASNRWLTMLFGVLLLFAAFSGVTGLARRMRFRGWVAWVAGALSGMLGGLVGNQGGIRSAALIGFDLRKDMFVGTATAIALFVDGARVPIYLYTQHDRMRDVLTWIVLAIAAVVAGTLIGTKALGRIPDVWFRRVLALMLAVLGIAMLVLGGSQVR
jgi:uncharacterized membrane protein YfcA